MSDADLSSGASKKPIGLMNDSEIADWQRSLLEQGAEPSHFNYSKGPSGRVVRFDKQLNAVIESDSDGSRYVVSLRDGQLERTPLSEVALPRQESGIWPVFRFLGVGLTACFIFMVSFSVHQLLNSFGPILSLTVATISNGLLVLILLAFNHLYPVARNSRSRTK